MDVTVESSGDPPHERARARPDRDVVVETEKKIERPSLFKVLLHNDDYTTKEFVVQVLEYVFHKDNTEAVQIMLHVHRTGIGVAGVYHLRGGGDQGQDRGRVWRASTSIRSSAASKRNELRSVVSFEV